MGYYAGKAVHMRTVVEKVRERQLENGKMTNVLQRWNERAWAKRGFHTLLELPEEEGNVSNRADAKRFRIVVIPGSVVSSQIDTTMEVELQGERVSAARGISATTYAAVAFPASASSATSKSSVNTKSFWKSAI